MVMSLYLIIAFSCLFSVGRVYADRQQYSTWMLNSIISRGEGVQAADGLLSGIQKGIFQEALRAAITKSSNSTQRAEWADYHQQSLAYNIEEFLDPVTNSLAPLDRLCIGVSIMQTRLEDDTDTFTSVISALRKSLDLQETNANGGWWYFTDPPPPYVPYTNLSYSDGMYGVAPFAVLYGQQHPSDATINISTALDQLEAIYIHAKHKNHLLVHGYDASKTTPWANPVTGASPIVWGRSMAWYMLGLLNALEISERNYSTRHSREYARMRTIFRELAHGNIAALWKSAQVTSRYGVWQVVDKPGEQGNFIESSASAMMAYILNKGMRLEYIDPRHQTDEVQQEIEHLVQQPIEPSGSNTSRSVRDIVQRLYDEVVRSFVVENDLGELEFHGTSALSSLHVVNPYYKYYISRLRTNDSLIGESAFVLASLENEYSSTTAKTW